ncbi:hypothetical protein F5Y05DRAFT_414830 [Hypoxylon sp. FL0543]|nr:hypothetical protein F5Y05DRAFT_414830 [Hypoxylon sp. FL0543]
MDSLAGNRVLYALEDIIHKEVESKLMNLSADDIVHAIQRRRDCQTIQNKLFNHLDGARLTTLINAREDSSAIYVDLLKQVIARMDSLNQTQHELHLNPLRSPGRSVTVNVAASTQTDMALLVDENSDPATPKPLLPIHTAETRIGDTPALVESTEASHCAYLTKEIPFMPQPPGLSAWVPMFMNRDEFHSIGPHLDISDATSRTPEVAKGLFDFIKFLNPPYLCARAEYILSLAGKANITLRGLDTIQDAMKLWNTTSYHGVGQKYITDIAKAFSAFHCFNQCKNMPRFSARKNQFFESSELLEDDSELEVFHKFAELDPEYLGRPVPKFYLQKWRNIVRFGARLSSLLNDNGGEPFMILFPLYELGICIEEKLVDTHFMDYLWGVIKSLLVKTGLGGFLRSLSSAVGELLLSGFGNPRIPRPKFAENLLPVLRGYSLSGIQLESPRESLDTLIGEPRYAPLVYCGNSYGSFPASLVRHLLCQGLSDDWCVLGEVETRQVASENMLLHDYKGVVIPLRIFGAWTLFFYTNPTRSKVTYPMKFIDPTNSVLRFTAATRLLTKWIPVQGDWVPDNVDLRSIRRIASQVASLEDSGIHVILHAIAMAKTGRPESRPLGVGMCKAIRLRYFVNLLNEMQTAVTKASAKR